MARIDGVPELISQLERLAGIWDDPELVQAAAGGYVTEQKKLVRAKLNKAPRGVLEGALQVIPINATTAEAGIPLNTIRYALAHEYGVVIRPKKKKALAFEIDGKEIVVQSVTIPARSYVRASIADGNKAAVKILTRQTIKKIVRG